MYYGYDCSGIVIYKIYSYDVNIKDIYIGYTKNFENRKKIHEENSEYKNTKLYISIRENGGWDNWNMIIIEKCNYNTREEVLTRQRELIKKLNANLNTIIPIRSKEEKKEIIICNCGGSYTYNNKSKHIKTIKHKEYENMLI